jgi:hypothetical protein
MGLVAASRKRAATSGVSLTVIQRDDTGKQLATDTLTLSARGHTSFDLKSRWSALADRRGAIEVRRPTPGGFRLLGLRFNPQGAFTTVPVGAT